MNLKILGFFSCLIFVFFCCTKTGTGKQESNLFIGSWDWCETIQYWPTEVVMTPDNTNKSETVSFNSKFQVNYYIDSILEKSCQYFYYENSQFIEICDEQYYYEFKKDSLILSQSHSDGLTYIYKRSDLK